MKATDFTCTTQEIVNRIFDEKTAKELNWRELSDSEKNAVNEYPCEITEFNGVSIIFIDGFAEVYHPEMGSFWAKGENVEIVREFSKTGCEFDINGYNEITR